MFIVLKFAQISYLRILSFPTVIIIPMYKLYLQTIDLLCFIISNISNLCILYLTIIYFIA